jgi:hypothetical protein
MRHVLLLFLGLVVFGPQTPQSPLVEALHQASRQEHEKSAEPLLETAQELLAHGADVNAAGPQQRTPLHWAVIGGMSARGEKATRTYVELVEQLIHRGANVNAEDAFGATPLDYQENSSASTEITFLLIDNGAGNGSGRNEAARLKTLLEDLTTASQAGDTELIRAALKFDLPIGTALQARLITPVSTNASRAGDVIEAVLTAPVAVDRRVTLAPRARVLGTVMLSQKAANDFTRAQLIVNFANLINEDGSTTRLLTRLVDVDNAKESVQAGRVIGVPHPNSSRIAWALRALGVTDPVLGDALQSALFVRDKEYKRAIDFPSGTDMTLTIESPVKFDGRSDPALPAGIVPVPADPALTQFVQSQPVRTETSNQTPSDLTNLLLIGSRDQLDKAFQDAGWSQAADLGLTADLKTFAAVAESRGYRNAPVSVLLLDGRKPDVVYQKQTDTFAKRHHIRIWRASTNFENSEVWIAAATHDVGVAVQKGGREWFHRIDPQVDRERAKVTNDLTFTGAVRMQCLVDRPQAPRDARNATGDRILTDGRIAALFLQ